MANYIKEYKVLENRYGIEDFKSPGEHFFDGKDTDGSPRPRFMLWAGGCGIGQSNTLDQANDLLYQYIFKIVERKLLDAKTEVTKCQKVMDRLNSASTGNLASFKVPRKGKQK